MRASRPSRRARSSAQTTPEEAWIAGIEHVDVLEELPSGQRDALEVRVVRELDYAEVARRLDTTPAAARVRVTRALAALRNQMPTEETT
jgi:RNA polymerase sigma-70 factor, ECF subfamily